MQNNGPQQANTGAVPRFRIQRLSRVQNPLQIKKLTLRVQRSTRQSSRGGPGLVIGEICDSGVRRQTTGEVHKCDLCGCLTLAKVRHVANEQEGDGGTEMSRQCCETSRQFPTNLRQFRQCFAASQSLCSRDSTPHKILLDLKGGWRA